MKKLYIVGPISALWQDVPLRVLHVLRESSLIVTQDIDLAREWLRQGDIRAPLIETGSGETVSLLLAALCTGDVAWLVTRLAELSGSARRLICSLVEQGIEILSVPGPSPAVAGFAVSGLPTDSLTFLGMLPGPSNERHALLKSIADESRTVVCEATADRLSKVLQDVLTCLGDRRVMLYGERGTWRGQASEVGEGPGGERLTLVIEGADQDRAWTEEQVGDEVDRLLAAGASPRDVAREIARRSGWPKRQVYQMAISVRGEK